MNKNSISSLIIDLIIEIKKNFLNYHSTNNVPILYLLIFKSLEDSSEMRVSDLARIFGISKPSITEIIQKMENEGIIYKKQGKDKRDKYIILTDKGLRKKNRYKKEFRIYMENKINKMSLKDKNILKRDLESIISILQK
ncbi:MarR family transcriptional regulator [Patescibacteria group bacterium]|nr:MarR family transcriptional regulator [Patescibacteria group bacterium]